MLLSEFHTVEDIEKYRYGKWAGNPSGYPYDPSRCAEEIMTTGRGALPTQCSSKPGHGLGGRFCSRHAAGHPEDPSAVEKEVWYRVFMRKISSVFVYGSTDKMVTIECGSSKRRVKKFTEDVWYFPTFEAAREFLLSRAESKLKMARFTVESMEKEIQELRDLTEPHEDGTQENSRSW